MASFRQMATEGVIKRADAEKIDYFDLHIEPGFNIPGRTEEEDEEDESLYFYICNGGRIPELEVRVREEGGVWIVDGHRRHKQIGKAIKAGKFIADPKSGKYLIPIKQFIGNDVDRVVRLATSSANKKPTAIQLAYVYKRLRGFNLTAEEIATHVNRKVAHVKEILILADSNSDVQQMVKAGEVSATIATNMVKKKGENAGAILKEAHNKAKANGRKKVTAATLEKTPMSMKKLNAMRWDALMEKADWSELIALRRSSVGTTPEEFNVMVTQYIDELFDHAK